MLQPYYYKKKEPGTVDYRGAWCPERSLLKGKRHKFAVYKALAATSWLPQIFDHEGDPTNTANTALTSIHIIRDPIDGQRTVGMVQQFGGTGTKVKFIEQHENNEEKNEYLFTCRFLAIRWQEMNVSCLTKLTSERLIIITINALVIPSHRPARG